MPTPSNNGIHMKLLIALVLVTLFAAACTATDDQQQQPATPAGEAKTAGSPSAEPIGPGPSPGDQAEGDVTEDRDASGDAEFDRELDVEITIPPGYFEGVDQGAIQADAQEQGIHDVMFEDDGSVTFNLSRAKHRQMMAELGDEVAAGLRSLPDDHPSIEQVDHNRDFTRIALTVDRDLWEGGLDELATLSIGFAVGLYHAFDGTDPDNTQINVDVIDTDTNEVFDIIRLSDTWGN